MTVRLEVLAAEEIQAIHEATLDVLSRVGHAPRALPGPAARGRFRLHRRRTDTKTVRFPPEVITAALKTVPRSFTLYGADPSYTMPIEPDRRWFAPNGAPTAVLDFGASAPRTGDDEQTFRSPGPRRAPAPHRRPEHAAVADRHPDDDDPYRGDGWPGPPTAPSPFPWRATA